ncbi:hypothetical protein [uncultured Gelidibacter sp.]|uniref:hypothetical protein n=1 Tax=uncultured Gelidibacter sp. TaxID=259318 RepID=UPI00263585B6|nr:hypothetical protein [uncultured Gelidibacter sp.]
MMSSLPLKFLRTYFLLSLLVFLGVQSLKYFSIASPDWIIHHLNDFLVIPMVATLGLHAVWVIKKDDTIRLNLLTIFSLVALFSIVFEYYLPQHSYRYTGDCWDVFAYVLGGCVFFVLQKME